MILAFVVYGFLMFLLCYGGIQYRKNPQNNYKSGVLIPLLVFTLIIGLRDGVGIDFYSYRDAFLKGYDMDRMEIGFKLLIQILKWCCMPAQMLFIVVAFLQVYTFTRFTKYYPNIYPWTFFFYFTTLFAFFSFNGLRQSLAFTILLWSVYFIYRRQPIKYLILVLLAASIHRSALLFMPFYYLLNYDIIKNQLYQFLIYIGAFVFGLTVAEQLWLYFDLFVEFTGIEGYNTNSLSQVEWGSDSNRGLGLFFWLLTDSFVIFNSNRLKEFYKDTPFNICYQLYFIGIFLEPIVGLSYLMRINIYFVYFRIIVYAFLMQWVFKYQRNKLYRLYASFLLLVFIAFMINAILVSASECSPFKFI